MAQLCEVGDREFQQYLKKLRTVRQIETAIKCAIAGLLIFAAGTGFGAWLFGCGF